jgi:lysophospholipase L1-like esterase
MTEDNKLFMNWKSVVLLLLFYCLAALSCTTEDKDFYEDYTPISTQVNLEDSDNCSKGFLSGKTFSILGNSISTYSGYIPKDYRNYYSSKHFSVDKTWWMQFAFLTGATLLSNASWSGTTVTYTGLDVWNSYFYSDTRIDYLGNKGIPDIIIVIGGTNDWGLHPCDLGNYPSEDTLTFVGAYTTMLKRIKKKYNDSFIICSSILPRSQSKNTNNSKGWNISMANNIIERLATDNDCLFVDMDECGINNPSSQYMLDSVHPNAKGMRLIAEAFEAFIHGLLID